MAGRGCITAGGNAQGIGIYDVAWELVGQAASLRGFRDVATAEGVAAYAKKQSGLRFALRENFNYLWRHAGEWIGSGAAPMARRWYHDTIIPRGAPQNVFSAS